MHGPHASLDDPVSAVTLLHPHGSNARTAFWTFTSCFLKPSGLLGWEFEEEKAADTEFSQCSLFSNAIKLTRSGLGRQLSG